MAVAGALDDFEGGVACGFVEFGLLGNIEHRVTAEIHYAYECHTSHRHDCGSNHQFQYRKARSAILQGRSVIYVYDDVLE